MDRREAIRPVVCTLALLLLAYPAAAARGPFGDELSREQFGRDRTVDVEHYKLDVSFDPERKTVGGTVSIRLRPLNDGLSVVELDAGEMEIDQVVLEGGEQDRELLFRHDGEKLRIGLPRPYAGDEVLTFHVRYSTQPHWGLHFVGPDESYPDRPEQLWSQGESEYNHHWFPSFDYPSDRATTEQIYTVPADWTAIGNGELVEVREEREAGTRSFRYVMKIPYVSYLVSVIAGRFEKYEDEFDGIPVEYYVPEGTGREKTLRSFGETPAMLRFFSEKTGVRYPYAKYSQACAVDFIYGGMENISATTQTATTLHDERAALESDSLGLVAHEAAHQWFGDLLTCANWSHAWLNEGFATYWENLWVEHSRGEDEFLYEMLQDRDSYLNEDRSEYRRAIVEHRYTDPMDLFDSHLYPKGAWVLHMLRGLLGDERFFKAMAHYTRTHREQIVETDDLRRSVSETSGADLGRFFLQWTRMGGHPELEVTRDWDDETGVLALHFAQVQEVDDLTPVFRFPIDVAVDTATGTIRRRIHIKRAVQDLTLSLDSEPLLVRIDPDFRVLAELELERTPTERLRALHEDPSPIGRIFAARDLTQHGKGERAIAGLVISLASDPFYGVRIEIAKALGAVKGDAARDALVVALEDENARVRTAAARALGRFRDDPVAARALNEILSTERAYGTYAAAVVSLARIRAEGASEVAVHALELDSHREVIRSAALEALGELGGPEEEAILREWTAYGKPPPTRTAAIAALAKIAEETEDRRETVSLLLELLRDRYIFARRAAMKALGELHAEEALEPLTRSASVEPDSRLRREARIALREIRMEDSEGTTVQRLAAEVEQLREQLRYHGDRIGEIDKRAP